MERGPPRGAVSVGQGQLPLSQRDLRANRLGKTQGSGRLAPSPPVKSLNLLASHIALHLTFWAGRSRESDRLPQDWPEMHASRNGRETRSQPHRASPAAFSPLREAFPNSGGHAPPRPSHASPKARLVRVSYGVGERSQPKSVLPMNLWFMTTPLRMKHWPALSKIARHLSRHAVFKVL